MKVWLIAALLALGGGVGLAAAQEPGVPAEGVAAEAAGDWEAAIAIYERAAADNGRADLWARVSRIHATRDRPRDALDAIERAVALEPDMGSTCAPARSSPRGRGITPGPRTATGGCSR